MQVTQKNLNDTKVVITLVADDSMLQAAKEQALKSMARSMRLPGFREGKAPLQVVEKNADPATLQSEFLDIIMNKMYGAALDELKLRPVAQPQVNIKKFVPFTELELDAEVETIGDIILADYKKMKLEQPEIKVTSKEVDEVIENLLSREAEKTEVKRVAKNGDEVTIDFKGIDTKTKEAVSGADGKDYPLELGSNTFIPGFEPNLVGMKAGEEKTFDINFPKDYGVKALQNRAVTFTVTVKAVKEATRPKLDDALAEKVGPFKNVAELKADIEKQLVSEKEYQASRDFSDQIILKIADESKAAIPAVLIEEQVDRMEAEERRNLVYRGQTWDEHLEAEGVTAEEHRARMKDDAERRVKAGIILSEIAEAEGLTVTPEELDMYVQMLKTQYTDPQMQAELDKPEGRRDIASRILSDKTLAKLKEYIAKPAKEEAAKPKKATAKPAKKVAEKKSAEKTATKK